MIIIAILKYNKIIFSSFDKYLSNCIAITLNCITIAYEEVCRNKFIPFEAFMKNKRLIVEINRDESDEKKLELKVG